MNNSGPLRFAKTFYFFFYGAWACLSPFLALYYKSQGFSGSQIGLLASITPLTTLFAAPFWGGYADATHRHKGVLLCAMIGSWTSVLALSQARSFWIIALLVFSYAFFTSTIIPLIDNAVITLLGERRDRYGAQRLWGAIGWGIAGPVIGWIIGNSGLGWSFGGFLSLLILAILAAWHIPIKIHAQDRSYWNGIRRLLADQRWYLFLMVAFISGAGLSIVSNFLFLYMDELHASKSIMGLGLLMATISEVPVLFFSGQMIRRWGPRGLLTMSLAAYGVRSYAYAAATEPWQILIIQLLHGLTFSTMLVAGVSFANEIAPKGMGATAQGLFTSTVSGLGGITGALVGGFLLDRLGGGPMFFWSGTAVLAGLLVFMVFGKNLSAAAQVDKPQIS